MLRGGQEAITHFSSDSTICRYERVPLNYGRDSEEQHLGDFSDFLVRKKLTMVLQGNYSLTLGKCSMDCASICASARSLHTQDEKLVLLSSQEIIQQVRHSREVRSARGEWNSTVPHEAGFLGQGEPLHSENQVKDAITELFALDPPISNVLLSTTGVRPNGIRQLARLYETLGLQSGQLDLQFSLWHPDETTRSRIIPGTPRLDQIVPALDEFAEVAGVPVRYNLPQVHEFMKDAEYVRGVAQLLAEKPRHRVAKLSSFNADDGSPLTPASQQEIGEQKRILERIGVSVKVFHANREDGIQANCGRISESTRILGI